MGTCSRCGKKGWFLSLNNGLCRECVYEVEEENKYKQQELELAKINEFRIFRDSLNLVLNSKVAKTIIDRANLAINQLVSISSKDIYIENEFVKTFRYDVGYFESRLFSISRLSKEFGDIINSYGKDLHEYATHIFEDAVDPDTGEIVIRFEYEEKIPYILKNNKQYEKAIDAFDSYLSSISNNFFLKTKYYYSQMAQIECLYKFRDNEKYIKRLEAALFENAKLYSELNMCSAYSPAYHYLVQYLISHERYDEALEWCEKAILNNYRHTSQGGYEGIKERILKKIEKQKEVKISK